MTTMIKLLLFVFTSSFFIYDGQSCCCTMWFGWQWCYCNTFGCNCKGEYCSYAPFFAIDNSKCEAYTERCAAGRQKVISFKYINGSSQENSRLGLKDLILINFQSRKLDMKYEYPLNLYKNLDSDRNGHICKKEWEKAKKFLEKSLSSANTTAKIDMKEIFKSLDLNENGKIEPEEIDESLKDQVIFA